MQPHQRAAEAIRAGEQQPINFLKNLGLSALGGGAAVVGSKALSGIIPAVGSMINQYVPDALSKAGLAKIDPRFGKFIQGALDEGYSYDDVRTFLGEKLEKSQAQGGKNIIEQYSPELHQFITEKIQKGRSPIEAGALANVDEKFKKIISKLKKDHKADWADILQTVYGQAQGQDQNAQEVPQQQQTGPAQQQSGAGQQALMQILQKIQQSRGV